jgi:hypothetical protein
MQFLKIREKAKQLKIRYWKCASGKIVHNVFIMEEKHFTISMISRGGSRNLGRGGSTLGRTPLWIRP